MPRVHRSESKTHTPAERRYQSVCVNQVAVLACCLVQQVADCGLRIVASVEIDLPQKQRRLFRFAHHALLFYRFVVLSHRPRWRAQVSHVSTECEYPLGAEAKDMIEDEWAVSQVSVIYRISDIGSNVSLRYRKCFSFNPVASPRTIRGGGHDRGRVDPFLRLVLDIGYRVDSFV